MTNNLTELVYILDRSGSMAGLEGDTIGGFNALLTKQQGLPGDARVTTVLFDDRYELLHDRLDVKAVKHITQEEYYVRGCTALLDAMGRTIKKVDGVMAGTAPEHRPDRVLFVIITDGMENASRNFTAAQVQTLVSARREMGWEFMFLGANMDAIAAAKEMGINPDLAQNYTNDPQGVAMNYQAIDYATTQFRGVGQVPRDWSQTIKERETRK
ncbi:MAG: VWA domain-containing protein [Clostridiales bacterium]|nr:VWA domain-containing protein [Clostridiales bacterium]